MYARLTMRSLAGDEVSAMNSIWMMPDNGRAVSESTCIGVKGSPTILLKCFAEGWINLQHKT